MRCDTHSAVHTGIRAWLVIAAISGLASGVEIKCEITSSLRDRAAAHPGESVQLNCTLAAGTHVEEFEWKRNGRRIAGLTHCRAPGAPWVTCATVQLSNVTTKDAGKYVCEARRGSHVDREEWTLHVCDPPHINKTSRVQSEWIRGTTKYLSCGASGYPAPNVTWMFNGRPIHAKELLWNGAFTLQRVSPSRVTLRVFMVTEANEGQYTCVAQNAWGMDEYAVAVRVRGIPTPATRTSRRYYVAKQGQDVTLNCTASGIYRESTQDSWTFNGLPAPSSRTSKRFLPGNTMRLSLRIANISDQDAGVYACKVKVISQTSQQIIYLIVESEGLPTISAASSTIIATVGSSPLLNCTATYSRYSKPRFTWRTGGAEISPRESPPHIRVLSPSRAQADGNVARAEFSLEILNVTARDSGWYRCIVNTSVGWNYTSIHLTIESASIGSPTPDSNSASVEMIVAVITVGSVLGCVIAFVIRYQLKKKSQQYYYGGFESNKEYKYDAFITFSSRDSEWVKNRLVVLLDKRNLKYCIHTRDFEIGKAIFDNIAESVYKSRKVISVMSENYMSSKYCRDELDMALYRSTELEDSSLIVIRIDNIAKSKLPKALRNKTFLNYADLDERNHWEKRLLKYLLAHDSQPNWNETAF